MKPLFAPLAAFSSAIAMAAAPLWAEPATDAGAERIASALSRYLGRSEGVVTVTPEGETYRLLMDFGPIARMLTDMAASADDDMPETSLAISPLVYTLEDRGDGTWAVSDDQSLTFNGTMGDVFAMSMRYGAMVGEGVFDESLQTFSDYSLAFTDFESSTRTRVPDQPEQATSQTIASGQIRLQATAGAGGGVDGSQTFALKGMEQMQLVPMVPGQPPLEIRVTSASYGGDTNYAGLRWSELLDVMAFFVAHPSAERIVAAQEDLRGLLKALGPIAETLDGGIAMDGIDVVTPFGPFGIQGMSVDVDMTGLVSDARLRERIEIRGATAPAGLVPQWAVPLVPTDMMIDFEGGGIDLAAPAALLIDRADLSTDELVPPEVQAQLLGLTFPDGRPAEFFVHPGHLTGPGYKLTFELAGKAGPASPPLMSAVLRLTGVETIQAALNDAPDEMVAQAGPMMAAAIGLARRDGDALVWQLEATETGSFSINGMNISGAP